MSQTRRCRATGGAGEDAIEVASIGDISGADHESEWVHDRHRDNGAAQVLGVEGPHHLANDFDSIDLVAVDAAGHPNVGPGGSPVDHGDWERGLRTGGEV